MLKIGQNAPEFSLPNQDDITISLKDFKVKKFLYGFLLKLAQVVVPEKG